MSNMTPSDAAFPWIDIAWRWRTPALGSVAWTRCQSSPYSVKEAKAMAEEGVAFMAQRHEAERIVLVVKFRKRHH